jgi:ElaB/YqjD/DUF883 family membrane-anchored ribosome-binding protein
MSENETLERADTDDDRSTDEIRRDIERRRQSIAETVEQAGQKIEETLDWHTQVREHPFAALAIAAGVGYVASGILRRRRTAELSKAMSDGVVALSGSLSDSIRSAGRARSGLAQALGAAVTAVAARVLVQMLRDVVVVERSKSNPSGGYEHEHSIH